MNNSTKLYNQAVNLGLCEDWKRDWSGDNIESLCKMFKDGIHFCIEKNYPDIDFMVQKFRGKTERFGVYISEMFSFDADQLIYVLNGNCKGKVINSEYFVTKIYVRHNSDVTLIAKGNSITYVDMYDNSKLNISIHGSAKVVVNKYGGFIQGDIDKARIKLHTEEN
jgi:hypothetical protein